MMNTGVYQIINLINDKRYIGSSINLKKRKDNHLKLLKDNKSHNSHLQNSYNKHSKQNFKFEILCNCKKEELIELEQLIIDSFDFKTLYNIRKKVESNLGIKWNDEPRKNMSERRKGKKASLETKKKMREAAKGKKLSSEHKKKLSESKKGKSRSEGTKIKLREANLGKKHSKESIKKMSEIKKGKKFSLKTRKKMSEWQFKPIKAFIYETGEFIGEYKSQIECAEILNLTKSNIPGVLSKKQKHHKGYTFEYIKNEGK